MHFLNSRDKPEAFEKEFEWEGKKIKGLYYIIVNSIAIVYTILPVWRSPFLIGKQANFICFMQFLRFRQQSGQNKLVLLYF